MIIFIFLSKSNSNITLILCIIDMTIWVSLSYLFGFNIFQLVSSVGCFYMGIRCRTKPVYLFVAFLEWYLASLPLCPLGILFRSTSLAPSPLPREQRDCSLCGWWWGFRGGQGGWHVVVVSFLSFECWFHSFRGLACRIQVLLFYRLLLS